MIALHNGIPVRSITLFIFGGVAQIGREPGSPGVEFRVAIAGPIVSFALAGLFGALGWFGAGLAPLSALAIYLAYINGSLALFNLIPGFPLDGGRVFRAIVWQVTHSFRRATEIAGGAGHLFAWLFIFWGVWQMFGGNFVGGLWIAFIGWFLENAATASVQQMTLTPPARGPHRRQNHDARVHDPDTGSDIGTTGTRSHSDDGETLLSRGARGTSRRFADSASRERNSARTLGDDDGGAGDDAVGATARCATE